MNKERLLKVLLSPHVSEKSAILAEKSNQYVFKVLVGATKPEIKVAVQTLFDVEVESVKVLNIKGKKKIFKGRAGKRNNIRKAVVRLTQGQEIDFVGGE